MPYGAGSSAGGGENIQHFGAIRVRVNGSGNLRPTFIGLDGVLTETLMPIVMSTTPGQVPLRLANFKNQRARLKLETTAQGEYFIINRIIVYAKPLWTSYVG